jgi:hypothetical protein
MRIIQTLWNSSTPCILSHMKKHGLPCDSPDFETRFSPRTLRPENFRLSYVCANLDLHRHLSLNYEHNTHIMGSARDQSRAVGEFDGLSMVLDVTILT